MREILGIEKKMTRKGVRKKREEGGGKGGLKVFLLLL